MIGGMKNFGWFAAAVLLFGFAAFGQLVKKDWGEWNGLFAALALSAFVAWIVWAIAKNPGPPKS